MKKNTKRQPDCVLFTEDMKATHTILMPNMLPVHLELVGQVLRNEGYKAELLSAQGPEIIETGLRYVHNDACYPALLIVGQFIYAIQSGRYDPHKIAFIYFQTGGGCRASNYIALIRRALAQAGYGYVPVISLNFGGLEKHPGFRMSLPIFHRMMYAVIYGDIITSLVLQVRPYEVHKGDAEALAARYTHTLADEMKQEGISFKRAKKRCRDMLCDFAAIEQVRVPKVKVGVVGEIYVKFSPLANNNLVDFLIEQGAEVYMPGFFDFGMYFIYNNLIDYKLYRRGRKAHPLMRLVFRVMRNAQNDIIRLIREDGRFRAPTPFTRTVSLIEGYIGLGCHMGEGWLLPAEMLELYDEGVKNIICTQPFGCLPNHICGKGMMKPLREAYPDMNLVAIDYDASASRVNQENRIKLMLANARERMEEESAAQSGSDPQSSAEAQSGSDPQSGAEAQSGSDPQSSAEAQDGINPQNGAETQNGAEAPEEAAALPN